MKINRLRSMICCLVVAIWSDAQCMDEQGDEPIRNQLKYNEMYQDIKSRLAEHLRVNTSLLHSSKDRDIVVVLGATGSGKSTLINYLMGLELKVNNHKRIGLIDPDNPLAMKIGNHGSETLLPKCTTIDSLVFYDLPGFEDTRGTGVNLLGSSFIKHIIENARSTRLIFVAGEDQMTAVRGKSVKELIQIAKTLFPHNLDITQSSLFVITKSIKYTIETLIPYIHEDFPDIAVELSDWLYTKRIAPMPKKKFLSHERDIIINKINNIKPSNINHVNIEAIYGSEVRDNLRQIVLLEMRHHVKQVLSQAQRDHHTIDTINDSIVYFHGYFEAEILQKINTSPLTILLKPLSENIFRKERDDLLLFINNEKELNLAKLDIKKQKLEREIERQETLRRHQEESERNRQYQERMEAQNRAIQEQARITSEAQNATIKRFTEKENETAGNLSKIQNELNIIRKEREEIQKTATAAVLAKKDSDILLIEEKKKAAEKEAEIARVARVKAEEEKNAKLAEFQKEIISLKNASKLQNEQAVKNLAALKVTMDNLQKRLALAEEPPAQKAARQRKAAAAAQKAKLAEQTKARLAAAQAKARLAAAAQAKARLAAAAQAKAKKK